ncbi:putative membrane protein [Rhizobium tibeticum]|nr:putative membrane protein [Rhizobium tibeticum]
MDRKQRRTQIAAFVLMLVTALLIIPAIMLNGVIGMLFDKPGSENNMTLQALAFGWLSLPLFFGFLAFRFLRVVMSPDIRGLSVAMTIGLVPVACVIVCGYVLWG